MRIRILWVTALLFTAFSLSLAAQEESVFAPFVSRLQGELRNNLVRLSWQDSPDVQGPVYIFRSNNPMEGNFPPLGIRPVEVPYGVQSFVDELEFGGTYYYYAAASDLTGRRFDILISANNHLSIHVQAVNRSEPIPAAAPITPMEASPPPIRSGISFLEAVPQGDRVLISFSAENVRSAALYRSVRPITSTPDLLGAVIIQTRISSPFTDFPVPGIPYFYAVIDEDDLVRGTVSIVPGINSTRLPVEVSISSAPGLEAPAQIIRAMPLPGLSAQAVSPGADPSTMPPHVDLSPQVVRVLDTIPGSPIDPSSRSPRVFARDMEVYSAGGEDHALSYIVRGSFSQRNWESARNELTRFLALPRSPETTARARFYLGQSLYFLNRPREGLFEFMAIQDIYPMESREWIQASLDLIRY